MTKQMVAASRVGIISTPNQPTYRRLLVEVTHSQNCCQPVGAGALLNGGGHENGNRHWAYARWQVKKVGYPDFVNVKVFCGV